MKIGANSKVIMMGDSVTDVERAKPNGEGLFDPYGRGYVAFVNALLCATYPERRIRIVNKGLSGNTVRDLENRWQDDVMKLNPDWVSIMIGINDVWRQFDMPMQPEAGVPLAEYEERLTALVDRTKPVVKGLILATPYYIESNTSDAMRARMDEYSAVVKKLAQKSGAVFVDTQAAFDAHLKHFHANAVAWDRVHPNNTGHIIASGGRRSWGPECNTGHMIIARAWLKAVGYEWR